MTTARVDRTPTYTDLGHRTLAAVQDAGRFGDRRVFIASLWIQVLGTESIPAAS
jgi:hypothetical protein